jgi:hypothetical protein
MDEETRQALKDALVREAVALGALFVIVIALGPGRVLVPAWISRARAWLRPADPHEAQVREFAREVSAYEHAARQDRRPADGGCGCGQ